jgi:hypothetical protein
VLPIVGIVHGIVVSAAGHDVLALWAIVATFLGGPEFKSRRPDYEEVAGKTDVLA